MTTPLDPAIAQIIPLLPLQNPDGMTPQDAREQLLALARSRPPLPPVADISSIAVKGASGPRPARVYRTGAGPRPTVLFFHGGGWVAGDLETHERQAQLLAMETGAVVVSVDYRRPPEAPFPAAFEDCFAALQDVAALARQISRQHADEGGNLTVITVGPRTEDEIAQSIQQTERGNTIAMPPWQMQRLLGVVASEVERVASSGRDPVVLCSSRIRLALRRLLERRLPNVAVLSFAEVTPQTTVEAVGNIEVNVGGNEAVHR